MLDYNILFAVQSPGPDLDIVENLAQSDGHLRDTPVQTPGLLDSFKKVGMTNSRAAWSTEPDKLFSSGL